MPPYYSLNISPEPENFIQKYKDACKRKIFFFPVTYYLNRGLEKILQNTDEKVIKLDCHSHWSLKQNVLLNFMKIS